MSYKISTKSYVQTFHNTHNFTQLFLMIQFHPIYSAHKHKSRKKKQTPLPLHWHSIVDRLAQMVITSNSKASGMDGEDSGHIHNLWWTNYDRTPKFVQAFIMALFGKGNIRMLIFMFPILKNYYKTWHQWHCSSIHFISHFSHFYIYSNRSASALSLHFTSKLQFCIWCFSLLMNWTNKRRGKKKLKSEQQLGVDDASFSGLNVCILVSWPGRYVYVLCIWNTLINCPLFRSVIQSVSILCSVDGLRSSTSYNSLNEYSLNQRGVWSGCWFASVRLNIHVSWSITSCADIVFYNYKLDCCVF